MQSLDFRQILNMRFMRGRGETEFQTLENRSKEQPVVSHSYRLSPEQEREGSGLSLLFGVTPRDSAAEG